MSSLVVIPIALYGISLISKMQIVTQPIWLVLQFVPIAILAWKNPQELAAWTQFGGSVAAEAGGSSDAFNFALFGLAASVLLSLLPQIGEQVDYLRFLPERTAKNRAAGGPRCSAPARAGWCSARSNYSSVRSWRCGWCARACTRRRPMSRPSCITTRFARCSGPRLFALVLTASS
jgi:hypothetical protein